MQKFYFIPILFMGLFVNPGVFAQSVLNNLTTAATFSLATLQKGENIFLKHVEECLNIIEEEANKIPMTGVAVAAYIPGDVTENWISQMRVVGKLADDKVNLLGIAYTKAAEMAVTHKDSGDSNRKNMRGEYGYEGGVIKAVRNGFLICAFSGGKSEDDVSAARKGLDWLASKYE